MAKSKTDGEQIEHEEPERRKIDEAQFRKMSTAAKKRAFVLFRPSSCANVFTYALFTVFPVVMFSAILVLKLRGNYLEQIDHLKATAEKLTLQTNSCLAERVERMKRIYVLETYEKRCRETLGNATKTLSALNAGFVAQWRRTDRAEADANATAVDLANLKRDLETKTALVGELSAQNAFMKSQLERMDKRLDNVTSSKIHLEGELGKVKTDLDGLKSNTSRLEGEKKGLEKVLEVKRKVKNDDDDSDSASEESPKKKKMKKLKEKKSIEKIVEQHIEKLGLSKNASNLVNSNNVTMPEKEKVVILAPINSLLTDQQRNNSINSFSNVTIG